MSDHNAPVTKVELDKSLQQLKTGLRDELTETMRDVQTEMLKAFYTLRQEHRSQSYGFGEVRQWDSPTPRRR